MTSTSCSSSASLRAPWWRGSVKSRHLCPKHGRLQVPHTHVVACPFCTNIHNPCDDCCNSVLNTALAHTKPSPARDNEAAVESVLLSTAQLATPPELIQLPLDDEDRAAWAAEMGARWRWSEFAPHLRYYYTAFGHGLMSQFNPVLWADGKFHAFHTKAGA